MLKYLLSQFLIKIKISYDENIFLEKAFYEWSKKQIFV